MKRFGFCYETIVRFDRPVTRHSFLLRSRPVSNSFQTIDDSRFYLLPYDTLHEDTDAFGNAIQYGEKVEEHNLFVFVSEGTATLQPYILKEDKPNPIYYVASALTQPSPQMISFVNNILHHTDSSILSDLDKALHLNEAIGQWMEYRSGSTDIHTPAAEAFAKECGVCQDYAHILIALCRYIGIAARYVNGFIAGTGETHAWAEIYSCGSWHGLDPTHQKKIEYGYIKLAQGRDAADCPVSRGVFIGQTRQTTEIRVTVTELPDN